MSVTVTLHFNCWAAKSIYRDQSDWISLASHVILDLTRCSVVAWWESGRFIKSRSDKFHEAWSILKLWHHLFVFGYHEKSADLFHPLSSTFIGPIRHIFLLWLLTNWRYLKWLLFNGGSSRYSLARCQFRPWVFNDLCLLKLSLQVFNANDTDYLFLNGRSGSHCNGSHIWGFITGRRDMKRFPVFLRCATIIVRLASDWRLGLYNQRLVLRTEYNCWVIWVILLRT